MNYRTLLAELGFKEEVLGVHEGKVEVPKHSLIAPFEPGYGFPPIIVPLWSDGALPGYIGVVTRWFGGEDRGFIKYYSASQYASEIALTFDQLKAWLTFDFLCNIPDAKEVGSFAESIHLCARDKVEEYFSGCNDYPDLIELSEFKSDLPQFLIGGSNNSQPSWVQPHSAKAEILEQIEQGDFLDAWHGINSPGLTRNETIYLLQKIAPFSGDERFHQLVDCWTEAQ